MCKTLTLALNTSLESTSQITLKGISIVIAFHNKTKYYENLHKLIAFRLSFKYITYLSFETSVGTKISAK